MSMFPEVAHRIPPAFERKIAADREVDRLLAGDVVNLDELIAARFEQDQARYSCGKHIEKQRGGGLA